MIYEHGDILGVMTEGDGAMCINCACLEDNPDGFQLTQDKLITEDTIVGTDVFAIFCDTCQSRIV